METETIILIITNIVVPIVVASEKGRIFLDNRLKVVGKPLSTNVYPPEDVRYPEPLI